MTLLPVKIFLGIDAGGTRTRAVLADESGRILGQGEAGPANYHNVGLEQAGVSLAAATAAAWSAAGETMRPAAFAFIGSAATKSRADIAKITALANGLGLAAPDSIRVANDLENALAGGLVGRPGIALIAGTGSNCLGRDAGGRTFMCGGWGWLVDDVGGGIGLGLAAVRAVTHAADGRGEPTTLSAALLEFLGLAEADELPARLYAQAWEPGQIAAFAPILMRHAAAGDVVARRVLTEGAEALAQLVAVTARRLELSAPFEVVVLGGCARSGEPYQTLVEAAIRRTCAGAMLREPVYSTTYGAVLNALALGGVSPLPGLILP